MRRMNHVLKSAPEAIECIGYNAGVLMSRRLPRRLSSTNSGIASIPTTNPIASYRHL